MNQQIYRIIRAHLDQTIEAAAIVPDKKLVNRILLVYAESLDALPQAISKYIDLNDILEETLDKPKEFDEHMQKVIPFLNNYVIPENGGSWDKLPKGIGSVSINYETNGPDGAVFNKMTGVTINLNKHSCKKLMEDWYIKKSKTSTLNKLGVNIGHELIHGIQDVTRSVLNKKTKQIAEISDDEKKFFSTSKPKLTKKINELKVFDNISKYIREKGKIVSLRDFKRYYNKILAKDQGWTKYVPSYLKPLYDSIKKDAPEDYIHVLMLGISNKIYKEYFQRYERYSDYTDEHTYVSDPIEIMAYAHSTVDIAHREGYTKEELLEILNNPEKNDKKLYPIDHYKFYKDLKGNKNISDKEKKDTWHKFLKYVAEYIDKIYKKEPR